MSYRMSDKKPNALMAIFTNYAFFEIFTLGILSGMPFSILYMCIVVMMKDMGVDLAIVTGLALARIPYSIKFLWSPFIDGLELPLIKNLGRRKSWMILLTAVNILMLISIISVASKDSFGLVQMLALLLGFGAASYDIAYDAWRIERVEPEHQATCGAVAVFGYRMGSIITSAGVLYCVGMTDSWNAGFLLMIIAFALALLFLFTVSDNSASGSKYSGFNIKRNVIDPFKDFLTKPMAIHILATIILYKAGEAMLGFVSTPFYLELGFSKQEIASVVKIFGVIATTIGTFAGGVVCYRLGVLRGLIVCGVIQMVSNLTFIWLNSVGPELYALFVTVAIDNFTGGMGMAALVGYLGTLCNREYTATQYALFSSATALVNSTFTAYSGNLVKMLGWNGFFVFTVALSLPALFILVYLVQHGRKEKMM
jgi:PAT family beta-lactamase induction signal transducer AmpG